MTADACREKMFKLFLDRNGKKLKDSEFLGRLADTVKKTKQSLNIPLNRDRANKIKKLRGYLFLKK